MHSANMGVFDEAVWEGHAVAAEAPPERSRRRKRLSCAACWICRRYATHGILPSWFFL